MTFRRRWLLAPLLALLLGLGGVVVGAGAVTRDGDRAAPASPVPVERVERFYPRGPSADYDGDAGGIGVVDPLTFTVPSGGTSYDAVVTLGLQYRTLGAGPFTVGVGIREVGEGRAEVDPGTLVLRRSAAATSTSVLFRARGLAPGATYEATPSVNSVFAGRGANLITTRKVLLLVDLTGR